MPCPSKFAHPLLMLRPPHTTTLNGQWLRRPRPPFNTLGLAVTALSAVPMSLTPRQCNNECNTVTMNATPRQRDGDGGTVMAMTKQRRRHHDDVMMKQQPTVKATL